MHIERIRLPTDAHGRRDESAWLRLRAGDYTASDMGALFGVGQRSTALAVYIRKAQRTVDTGSKYTRRGHILEPVVAAELTHRWPGADIKLADVYLRGRDPADPHLRIGATKDYDLARDGERLVLEIKTVAPRWFRRWWGKGKAIHPPVDNVLQVRTQMMLDDADAGILACLVCDDSADIHTFKIERVPRIEALIRRRVSAFWAAFDVGAWPRLQLGREAKALELLNRQLRSPPPIIACPRFAELAEQHGDRVRIITEAQRELAAIEDEMIAAAGDNVVVRLPSARRVTVGRFKGRRVKVEPGPIQDR